MKVDDESDAKIFLTENSNLLSNHVVSDGSVTDNSADGSNESSIVSSGTHNGGTSSLLDEYGVSVKNWTDKVPIGLGLCPWAIKSRNKGRLRYVTCEGTTTEAVSNRILSEADELIRLKEVPPLTTTLIVCPNISLWNKDFQAFDKFVKSFEADGIFEEAHKDNHCSVTLVSFHPKFLRWHGVPLGVQVGSTVQSHKGMAGFRKSSEVYPATILETASHMFGQRKVKVQFHSDQKVQYVSVDWLKVRSTKNAANENRDCEIGPPLPENLMHRSPYPTIHLIRNQDLGSLCARDVSRVKRLNAQKFLRLGWEGIEKKMRK
jgi:hypothetical protein